MSAASLFVVGLAVVLTLPVVARIRWRRLDPFEPIVLFVLAYGVMFVVRPAYMLVHGELTYGGVDLRGTFALACALALLGGTAFVCGYEVEAGSVLARRAPAPREISVRGAVVCAAILTGTSIAVLAIVLTKAEGFSGMRLLLEGRADEIAGRTVDSSYFWYGLRLGVPAAVCLFAVTLRERTGRLVVVTAGVTALSLVVTIPLGARVFLLPLLGAFFVLPFLRRGRRPGVRLLTLLAAAAIMLSYALGVVRDPDRRADARAESAAVVRAPQRLLNPILVGNDGEMAPVLAGALTVVPDRLGYRYGEVTLADLAVRPVPRELWPGKPTPPDEKIVGAVWPELAGIFHPVYTPLIFFYWDFGFVGVFVGMALFGVLCRTLYQWFLRHRGALAAQMMFATTLWFVVIAARNHPTETIVLAAFVLGPLVVLERLSGRRLAMPWSGRLPAEPRGDAGT